MLGSFSEQIAVFIRTGQVSVEIWRLTVFWAILVAALLLKHFVEWNREYPWHAEKGSFLYETYIRRRPLREFAACLYRSTFNLRPILLLLTFSPVGRLTSLLLVCLYLAEVLTLHRFHVVMATVILGVCVLDPGLWSVPALSSASLSSEPINAPSVIFVKTLVCLMYFSGARRKLQTGFAYGAVLREAGKFSVNAQGRKFPDHWSEITKFAVKNVIVPNAGILSVATIALQFMIPIMLLASAPFRQLGVGLAILMHLGITCLFPITLCFFTMMMFATFVLWI